MVDSRSPLPYGRQHILDEDVRAVLECLKSDWLTQGPRIRAFEESLCQATGAQYAVAVANGTAALHLACLALGVEKGTLGITSPITFVATANAIKYCGGRVAFSDVEAESGLMDLEKLEACLAKKTVQGEHPRLLIPVHFAGQPVDMPSMQKLAKKFNAMILEDAAHALGATYEDQGATYRVGQCAHSDAAIFSFHPVKHITTAEGGAIVTNRYDLFQRLQELRTHGVHKDPKRFIRDMDDPLVGPWYYELAELGYNYRLSDVHAALGISQLKRLESLVFRRREIAARYDAALAQNPFPLMLRPLKQHPGRKNAYHLYIVRLTFQKGEDHLAVARRRKDLYCFLHEQRILAQVHYLPVFMHPLYSSQEEDVVHLYQGALQYYASALSLPIFPAMTNADVDYVVEMLQRWVLKQREL